MRVQKGREMDGIEMLGYYLNWARKDILTQTVERVTNEDVSWVPDRRNGWPDLCGVTPAVRKDERLYELLALAEVGDSEGLHLAFVVGVLSDQSCQPQIVLEWNPVGQGDGEA